ncbi:hypothetical protein [Virgibacillus sp. L01]|uniref:hypothetical protein n=1 Tax=Virgibacillus sp. L01 TaxID=3457429 RepID=UPI003FD21DEE
MKVIVRLGVILFRCGVVLVGVSILIFLLSNTVDFFAINHWYNTIFLISSILAGMTGVLVVLIGVIRDRIKDKKEEDQNDVSKY